MYDGTFELSDFTPPIAPFEIVFVTPKPDEAPMFQVFAYPFSIGVWIACLVTLLAAACFANWFAAPKDSLPGSVLSLFGSLVRQPLQSANPAANEQFVWWMSWWWFSAFVSTVYIALFVSFMTMPTKGYTVRNFDELAEAVSEGKFECHILNKDVGYLHNSARPALVSLAQTILDKDWLIYSHHYPDLDDGRKNVAIVANREILELLMLGYLAEVQYSDDNLINMPYVFNVRKGFCCTDQLNMAILTAMETGHLSAYMKFQYSKMIWYMKGAKADAMPTGGVQPLSLEDVKYAFYVLLLGHAAAGLVLVLELCVPKKCARAAAKCRLVPPRPQYSDVEME